MAQPSWAILDAIPRVSEEQLDADLSLELAAPPRVSVLTVPPRVSPVQPDPTSGGCPWVVTADPASGLLLLCAPQPPLPPPPPSPPVYRNGVRLCSVSYRKPVPPAYFVCDVSSDTVFRLPEPGHDDPTGFPSEMINPFNLGVVAAPGPGDGGGASSRYMVVEFRYMFADEYATLLCFSSDTGEWVSKPVHNPMGAARWIWGRDGVVAHDGKLWWVDLAGGLIFCDPFPDAPVLGLIPFPDADCHLSDASCAHCAGRSLAFRRFVQVSAGKLRFVEWSSHHRDVADDAPMTVRMWTLNDPEAKEWALEYKVSFQEIWADESYKAAGLSEKDPTFALVHPMNPDLACFFLEEQLFSVDMRNSRVVECGIHGLAVSPSGSSLPSDVGSGSNTEESAPTASAAPSDSQVHDLVSLKIESEEEA